MAGRKKPDGTNSPGRVIQGHVDDWEELAIDYLDDTLDAVSKAAVDAHLETCFPCAARLGAQRAVCNVLRGVELDDAPSGLEDEVIGEILFPPTPRRADPPAVRASRWAAWRRGYRPWIPVSVAVVAFFAIMISVGVLRSGSMEGTTTTAVASQATAAPKAGETSLAAAPATTGAPATTTVAAAADASTMSDSTETALAAGAGLTTTTTAGPPSTPATTNTFAAPARDKQAMVAELQAASTPLYFVYQRSDPSAGASTAEIAAALAEQVTMLTGLEPLQGDLALDGATFAAFVPKKDATALVELLQSIGSSLRLTLNLVAEPFALPSDSARGADYGQALQESKAQLPELVASRTPQPAVTKYSFTTSTVVAESGQVPPGRTSPEDTSTYVLVVIYLGE